MDIERLRPIRGSTLRETLFTLQPQLGTIAGDMEKRDDLQRKEPAAAKTAFAAYGFMSAAEKTQAFMQALWRAISAQERAGRLAPVQMSRGAKLLGVLAALRQEIDGMGIPYDFFAVESLHCFVNPHLDEPVDTPHVFIFATARVLEYVRARWSDPAIRLQYELRIEKWDRRFKSSRDRGSSQHIRMHDVIAQRMGDAEVRGMDASRVLRRYLGVFIPEGEAIRRFGEEMVSRATHKDDPLEETLVST